MENKTEVHSLLLILLLVHFVIFPSTAQKENRKTLESLKIELTEVNICDTTIYILRTNDSQKASLTQDNMVLVVLKLVEEELNEELDFLKEGSVVKKKFSNFNYLKGKIDPQVIELYSNEMIAHNAIRDKITSNKPVKNEPIKKKEKSEGNTARSAITNAKDKINNDPELAVIALNEIVKQSNFSNSDNFVYKLTDYQYEEIAELKSECLIKLNRQVEVLPILHDLLEKVRLKKLHLNARSEELYLSKIILLKVDLNDTSDLFNYYEQLSRFIIPRERPIKQSDAYVAITSQKSNTTNNSLSISDLHKLAIEKAAPFCQEQLEQKQFTEKKQLNPHWGNQIPVGSLILSEKPDIDKLLGNTLGKTAEIYNGYTYEAFIYNTKNGKYHIVYKSNIATYIAYYPTVQQRFSEDELMNYGWKFDLLNNCSKDNFGLTAETGFIGNISHIDIYVSGGNNTTRCYPYHVIFYSNNGQYVSKVVVWTFFTPVDNNSRF